MTASASTYLHDVVMRNTTSSDDDVCFQYDGEIAVNYSFHNKCLEFVRLFGTRLEKMPLRKQAIAINAAGAQRRKVIPDHHYQYVSPLLNTCIV